MNRSSLYHLKSEDYDDDDRLVFQALGWYGADIEVSNNQDDDDENEEEEESDKREYVMKVFGVTRSGASVGLTLRGFPPFFYVSVPDFVRSNPMSLRKRMPDAILELVRRKLGNKHAAAMKNFDTCQKKNFWGFTNGSLDTFMRLTFTRSSSMHSVANLLKRDNVKIGSSRVKLKVFESNIDPILRFAHWRDIEMAGWVCVPRAKFDPSPVLPSTREVNIDGTTRWKNLSPWRGATRIAPLLIASFDIECTSSHGDFPVAVKAYQRVACDVVNFYNKAHLDALTEYECKERLVACLEHVLHVSEDSPEGTTEADVQRVILKYPEERDRENYVRVIRGRISRVVDDVYAILTERLKFEGQSKVSAVNSMLSHADLPELSGDAIIQIGTTFHKYGETECCYKHIATLGSCDTIDGVDVVSCIDEAEVLMSWRDMICRMDPDVIVGYNIMSFDMGYLRNRAVEIGIERRFMKLGRIVDLPSEYVEKMLSSAAMGDNVMKYIVMHGRTTIDLLNIMQREHKLEMNTLNFVAKHFTGQEKDDVSPGDIFRLQKGTSTDRAIVAKYCVQDCALCNYLIVKLEVIANNVGMANVCSVPFEFIFMRGQGIKIFSLVSKQCRLDDFLIPVVKGRSNEQTDEEKEQEKYEGALVLDPRPGIYLNDPVVVLDYASLYPSSMISENISHDSLVMDPSYDNLPGVSYIEVEYDDSLGHHKCRFAQPSGGGGGEGAGVLPRILVRLLRQRKLVRKKLTYSVVTLRDGTCLEGAWNADTGAIEKQESIDVSVETTKVDPGEVETVAPRYSAFEAAVLDGLQNAYKVTANSLYGQMGAATSQLYLKHVAACTTATGRKLLLRAKSFMESTYNAKIVYGDTDSVFMIFPIRDASGAEVTGKPALELAINKAHEASKAFKVHLRPPHDMEYDKTFWPFVIFAKKRYFGNLYEEDPHKFKRKYQGVAIKRRDTIPLLRDVYEDIVGCILDEHDIPGSVRYLREMLDDLVKGKVSNDRLIMTKTLKASYEDPARVAHCVLAQRMGERDPGNKPPPNERIPFLYIVPNTDVTPKHLMTKGSTRHETELQGNRIEHPDFVVQNKLRVDYRFYITNKLQQPLVELFSLVLEQLQGYSRPAEYWGVLRLGWLEKNEGDEDKTRKKIQKLREIEVTKLLFEPVLMQLETSRSGMKPLTHYFSKREQY